MAMAASLRDVLDRVDNSSVRWALIAVGVVILLRLRLILFAAALPLMAYWHYSQQEAPEQEAEATDADGADADLDDDLGPTMGDTAWPGVSDDLDDDDDLFRDDAHARGGDPLDLDAEDDDLGPAPKRSAAAPSRAPAAAPWRSSPASKQAPAPSKGLGMDDDLRLDGDDDLAGPPPAAAKDYGSSWDAQLGADDDFLGPPRMSSGADHDPLLDDFRPGAHDDDPLAGFGGRGFGGGFGGGLDDHDFLGGLGDDMDGLFGGGKGKGKGKGKFKDKGPMEPRGPNPKQVFVANVGDLYEDEIRTFFEEVGEVDRLKVLRNPDGGSKGVCFVTFRTEEQAQKALGLHGTPLDGRNLVVRLAHGGKGTEKGEKGGGGGKGHHDGPLDLGGSERFGAAFGERDHREREPRSGGKGGGKGKGKRQGERGELDDLLEEALLDGEGPLKPSDFDFAARRFLSELRSRDKADGTQRFQEAMDMVLKYTSSKDRSSVRKWPAYVFTLLQKFDPQLQEELREKDAERRMQKGGGPRGERPLERDRDLPANGF